MKCVSIDLACGNEGPALKNSRHLVCDQLLAVGLFFVLVDEELDGFQRVLNEAVTPVMQASCCLHVQ